ncbi:DNA topoisomerase IV subunit A [Aestuariivirga litoralis]|uniref:DNA topoisomerase IV subunit A n=1 Tax=Aestuariivirga litoralis TaxID=2650924 RepID=UPI0018C8501A|nr:DNA topoisomerase IV subunit A [Aestuariivirga litoralis]MBG1231829.1 DNA topoisomerase IV subunit A [Aestuariivirga litoralis]
MAKRDSAPPAPPAPIEGIELKTALEERYLAYALSTIMHRALPDVRDGLKPVHRRLLHVMRLLRLDPNTAFKKSAKIVGDVMGGYHPHGDQAIYEAMVRLAQDFSSRYPLVDGQGNFGNIDGDGAAAYRYTEARLTEVARLLLQDLEEATVDFRPNYDGTLEEPIVLPGAFPNLLANGATGIAVGMATSIPPHNVAEICDAALHLIKTPGAGVEKLCQFVIGPDFPTGGIVIDSREDIVNAYRTGRGGFRLRAKWEKEDLPRGGWQLVITEIPYLVQKSRLIERIAELLTDKKLTLLGDVRDESAEDVRIVLEPKSRNTEPDLLMEQLFRNTELESRISLNMNVLSGGKVPRVMSLKDVLREWLDHRREVLQRKSQHRLDEIARRLEILGGYLIAYLNIDEVIKIIREEDEPKPALMKRFKLSDVQAEAILNLRLRALRRLEEMQIKTEHDDLVKEQAGLKGLLGSEEKQWNSVSDDIRALKETFSKKTPLGKRRTEFAEAPEIEADFDAVMIEKEPVTVVLSDKGWIRAMKGHLEDTNTLTYKEGDEGKFVVKAQTTDKIMLFSSSGKFFTLDASKLPGGRGNGEPVRLMADIDAADTIVALFPLVPGTKLLVASTEGDGFVVPADECVATTRKGKQVLNVKAPVEAITCVEVPPDADHVATVGDNHKMLVFKLAELPEMSRGKGVRLQKFKDGGLADARAFKLASGMSWTDSSGRNFNVTELAEWIGERAQAGRLPPRGFPKNNKF